MRNKNIKTVSLFILVCLLFLPICFAAEWETWTMWQSVANFLHLLISILSWIRILIATLAGKLMTNSIVYWEFIHLDQALRKLRNIMKNVANFSLWLIFLRTVFKYVFSDKSDIKDITGKIFYFIIAWIWIQMSWFAIWALIDISTILTASMWSFPSMILSEDWNIQKSLEWQKIFLPKKTVLNLNDKDLPMYQWIKQTTNDLTESSWYVEKDLGEFIDAIVPSSDSVAWPLIYMWVSIFHFQDYLTRTITMAWETDITDLVTTFLIKAWMLVFYTIALIMMFVFNLIRVFYLRMLIIFSPLLIAFWAFKKWSMWPDKEFEPIDKWNIKNLLILIFLPVVYITYMWLTLIIIVTIQKMITSNEIDNFGSEAVQISGNTIKTNNSSFTLNGNLRPNWKEDTQTTFTDIFLMILSLALMYGMTKIISTTVSWIWWDTMWKLKWFQDSALKAIPIWSTSVGWVMDWGKNMANKYINAKWWATTKIADQTDKLLETMWLTDWLTQTQQADLKKVALIDKRSWIWKSASSKFIDKYSDMISSVDYKKSAQNFSNSDITSWLNWWMWNKYKWNNWYKYNWEQLIMNASSSLDKWKKNIENINKSLWENWKIESLSWLADEISELKNDVEKWTLFWNLFNTLNKQDWTKIKTKSQFMTTKRWKNK